MAEQRPGDGLEFRTVFCDSMVHDGRNSVGLQGVICPTLGQNVTMMILDLWRLFKLALVGISLSSYLVRKLPGSSNDCPGWVMMRWLRSRGENSLLECR